MILIHLPNGGNHAPVERFERGVVLLQVGELGDGLVQQIVPEHRGLILVPRGKPPPEGDCLLLRFRTLEEPGVAPTVVDVRSGLPPGAAWRSRISNRPGFLHHWMGRSSIGNPAPCSTNSA